MSIQVPQSTDFSLKLPRTRCFTKTASLFPPTEFQSSNTGNFQYHLFLSPRCKYGFITCRTTSSCFPASVLSRDPFSDCCHSLQQRAALSWRPSRSQKRGALDHYQETESLWGHYQRKVSLFFIFLNFFFWQMAFPLQLRVATAVFWILSNSCNPATSANVAQQGIKLWNFVGKKLLKSFETEILSPGWNTLCQVLKGLMKLLR